MNPDLKIIKNKYGEKMMHLCRQLFPTLLENPYLLSNLMLNLFEPTKELYNDIIKNDLEEKFKNYIYSNLSTEEKEIIKTEKTPTELLDEAGYILYECKTEEEIKSFKKYYKKEEALCTFNENRLEKCYVFFAVKKNIDEIKRENFIYPERQDMYGTSVISIQFTKGEINTLSIKNRYNHTVKNPDCTFSNNLENIIYGLTESFARVYNLNLENTQTNFELPGYVKANDGKYYKYNYECYNIYYCPNNIIIDNFKVIQDYHEKEKYLIIDYFILDLINKKIFLYDERIRETFQNTIFDIEKITIIKSKENGNKTIGITCKNNKIIIEINKNNQIIGYENRNIQEIEDNFLNTNTTLVNINLPNANKIGNWFLMRCSAIRQINLPTVEEIGHYFLAYNKQINEVNLPRLKKTGNSFLNSNTELQELKLPNLIEFGERALCHNNLLKLIFLPKLKRAGDEFLNYNNSITEISLPELEKVGCYSISTNCVIKKIDLPKLSKTGIYFLNEKNESLIEVNFPNYENKEIFISLTKKNRERISLKQKTKILK